VTSRTLRWRQDAPGWVDVAAFEEAAGRAERATGPEEELRALTEAAELYTGETEPELLWGLRGGGGNFGIATAFEYRLHPVGGMVLGGPVFWRLEDAPKVLGVLRDYAPEAPDELGITVTMMLAPPAPFLPAEGYGTPVVGLVLVWSGDLEEGRRAVAPLLGGRPAHRRAGPPRPLPDRPVHARRRRPPRPPLLLALAPAPRPVRRGHRRPRRPGGQRHLTLLAGQRLGHGRAVSRADPEATAVGEREVGFDISFAAAWLPGDPEPGRHVAWARAGWEALRPHSAGVYVNFISDEGDAGVETAYGHRLKRLTALKDRWDPANVFHMNANIPPSGP
jgi:hypothetical protein